MQNNPVGLCQCGCGTPTKQARQNLPKLGYKKGEYFRFKAGHDRRLSMRTDEETRALLEALPRDENGCWVWNRPSVNKGYGALRWRGKQYHAHRVSYEVFKGPAGDLYVCHKCDNRPCCNPDHLFLGTQKDNIRDMVEKGRHGGNTRRLRAEDVQMIRQLVAGGRKQCDVAKAFGVTNSHISNICANRIWKDV